MGCILMDRNHEAHCVSEVAYRLPLGRMPCLPVAANSVVTLTLRGPANKVKPYTSRRTSSEGTSRTELTKQVSDATEEAARGTPNPVRKASAASYCTSEVTSCIATVQTWSGCGTEYGSFSHSRGVREHCSQRFCHFLQLVRGEILQCMGINI